MEDRIISFIFNLLNKKKCHLVFKYLEPGDERLNLEIIHKNVVSISISKIIIERSV